MNLTGMLHEGVDSVQLVQDRIQSQTFVTMVMKIQFHKGRYYPDQLCNSTFQESHLVKS
jgi:hypothetical protein